MWARRGSFFIALIVVISSFAFSIAVLPDNARANTLYVGGVGPSNYTAIQDAVNNASVGNTVYVFNGIYKEQVVIEKTISMIGEDVDATFIEVDSTGRGIYIASDWVNVSGFTLLSKPWPPSSDPDIFGIELYESENCTILNNKLELNKKGVYLVDSDHNYVADNYGINNVDGYVLLNSDFNVLVNNTAFSSNAVGFRLLSSHHNVIAGNNASGNGGDGIHLHSSFDNIVSHNYVFGNIGPSYDNGENCWDNCYPSGGNFWNVYTGSDAMSGSDQDIPGSDGVGDTAFDIPGGANQDLYPLMSPVYFPMAPSPPEKMQVVAGDQHVNLTWEPPLFDGFSPVTQYGVYREDSLGVEILLATLGVEFEYSDSGLTNGETFTYRVSAINSIGEGCKSDDAIASPATLPGPPQGLSANAGIEEITLVWSPPSDDGGSTITNYMLYRGTTSGGEIFLILLGPSTVYLDFGLTSDQEYYYKVSAVNVMGEGSQSNEASATPLEPPPNVPPTVFLEYPLSGEVVFGAYQIGGQSYDSDGIVERVEVKIDNSSWGVALGTQIWAFAWNTSQFEDGQHTIYARSYDGENYSNVVNATVTVDNFVEEEEPDIMILWVLPVFLVIILIVVFLGIYLYMRGLKRAQAEMDQQYPVTSEEEEQEPEEP
jgi:parallel beta-helix repeat protein